MKDQFNELIIYINNLEKENIILKEKYSHLKELYALTKMDKDNLLAETQKFNRKSYMKSWRHKNASNISAYNKEYYKTHKNP